MESSTIRGFGGGWNALDDDITMGAQYAVTLKNFRRTSSGSQTLRWGNQFFVDIKAVNNSPIVDQIYFNNRIVSVCANGRIVTTTDAAVNALIWSPTIAAALPGAPAGWSTGLTLVTFVPFKDTLIIHNGVDKPVVISSTFAVTYLQDPSNGSNTNVPIGKYGCTVSNYHCIAGISGSPTQIVISSKGTSGVFPLDPAPNDAISIDVGAYAQEGSAEIRGIIGYRTFLIVFLQAVSLQITLGIYDSSGKHTPDFPDTFPNFGLIGSRCITKIENDFTFAGLQSFATASRNAYVSNQLVSSAASSVIEPAYQNAVGVLTDTQKKLNTFTVYDKLTHDLMLFIPGGRVIVYTNNEKMRYKSWSEYQGMDWTCGCASLLGRVFLANGTKIFQMGNATFGEKYNADRLLDRDITWANNTAFSAGQLVYDSVTNETYNCLINTVSSTSSTFLEQRTALPLYWSLYEGIDISFELETPWIDGKDPNKNKKLRYVSMATKGLAEYTLEIYVDNLYKDADGNKVFDAALSMDFIGNDYPGFGDQLESDPYGARRSRDPRLFKYPVKFKTAKFRIFGSTKKPLTIATLSFLFARGGYIRG
jgi:hypothetical protein